MNISPKNLVAEQMQNPDYRAAFVEQSVRRFLPAQIRAMREERGWSQEELGRRCGKTQEWICKLESQTYGRYSTQTLIDLARGFDVGLIIRLASFGSFLDWYTSRTTLGGIPSFEEDEKVTSPADGATPKLRLIAGGCAIAPQGDSYTIDQGQIVASSAA